MTVIPLFPLGTVLFPHGRMALQIFEPRYLNLIKTALKSDSGFGVVWIREGQEVAVADDDQPKLSQIGTYANIVDWHSLPNGLLGIIVEGSKKFRLLATDQQPDKLYTAEVEWLDDEDLIPLPEETEELKALLKQLIVHPHVARLNLDTQISDVSRLGCVLAQLLPIPEPIKFALLSLTDPLIRLEQLMNLLDDLSQ